MTTWMTTNAITTQPSHVTELFSWVSLPNCSPLFPNKISCFVSTCVSSDNSFPSVRQEPSLGPWKGSPFLQKSICGHMLNHLNAPALLFFLFPCSENSLPYLQSPILQDFLYTFSSIPGLLPPDSSSILNPHQGNRKYLQTLPNFPWNRNYSWLRTHSHDLKFCIHFFTPILKYVDVVTT